MAILLVGAILSGCRYSHPSPVVEKMTWSTDPTDFPGHIRQQDIPPNTIVLRYVRAPEYHLLIAEAPDLVEHLRRSAQRKVEVEFTVVCDTWPMRHRFVGFNETRIDGFPGPFGKGGATGVVGPGEGEHPLAAVCGKK